MEIQERREQALALRLLGLDYRTIANRLGVSAALVHSDVSEALAALPKPNAEEVRRVELERLENGHNVLTGIISDSRSKRLEVVKAVEVLVKLSESRRRLLGVDAPQKNWTVMQEIPSDGLDELLSTSEGAALVAQVEAVVSGFDLSEGLRPS